jgi:hypothetical protein
MSWPTMLAHLVAKGYSRVSALTVNGLQVKHMDQAWQYLNLA